jgi:hypothetical protein
MTPKEKAIELVDKFKIGDIVTEKLQIVNINIYSKLFALIAVGEIMNVIIGSYDYELEKIYWQDVKNEIEKL